MGIAGNEIDVDDVVVVPADDVAIAGSGGSGGGGMECSMACGLIEYDCSNRAATIRNRTYSVTLARISIPQIFSRGNNDANANVKPPKPHPMSNTVGGSGKVVDRRGTLLLSSSFVVTSTVVVVTSTGGYKFEPLVQSI